MKLFTIAIIFASIIIIFCTFIFGYETGKSNTSLKYRFECQEEWEETMEYVKSFAARRPAFVELPNGEMLILRYYPEDYIFGWGEDWPISDTIQTIWMDK